jgi:hypothetical protein
LDLCLNGTTEKLLPEALSVHNECQKCPGNLI